jgi:hypothetical protein
MAIETFGTGLNAQDETRKVIVGTGKFNRGK